MLVGNLFAHPRSTRHALRLKVMMAQRVYAAALAEAEVAQAADGATNISRLDRDTCFRQVAFDHYTRCLQQFSDFALQRIGVDPGGAS